MTDLHLEGVDLTARRAFYEHLRREAFDAALITGDISEAETLALHLGELADACAPRKVYFVLGNHDFYGADFASVDRIAMDCCQIHPNLHHLGQGEIVRLGSASALVGHRGWSDSRAYGGNRTSTRFPDQDGIRDLRYRSTYPAFRKMKQLGQESGAYFRRVLPYALTSYRRLIIATHFPPFVGSVRFDGKRCEATKLPHFVNASAGSVIQRIGEHFPKTKITVLCGHAHHGNSLRIANNLEVRVGQACRGTPTIQEVIDA